MVVRSGAKDLFTHAVASLLELRPANPVAFLAQHFDTSSDSVKCAVGLIRACPPQRKSFPSVVHRAFLLILANTSTSADVDISPTYSKAGISRSEYTRLLTALCSDLPPRVVDRVLDALRVHSGGLTASDEVVFADFKRGVHVSVLLEALLDVVNELFAAVDKGCVGEIKVGVLLSALENVAGQQSTQTDIYATALECLRSRITSSLASASSDASSQYIQLRELQGLLLDTVLTP